MTKQKLKLTDSRTYFKPFTYEWAYKAWLEHEQAHWLHTEIPLTEDIKDWNTKLTNEDRQFLTNIFRFFTQGDIDVAGAYVNVYQPAFPQPEVRMMLLGFGGREAIHIAAYSNLIETLGMPESTYNEFLQYREMVDKHEFLEQYCTPHSSPQVLAEQLAVFSAFTEGLQLFSSFVMLLNYPRHGLMKGMGQNITSSIADESMHVDGMIKLFRTFIEENRHLWNDELKAKLYSIAEKMVELEDAFIDLAFQNRPMRNLTAEELKTYIRYIADRRLISMGLKGIFKVKRNNLKWVDQMINAPVHGNFFENKVMDYAKGAMQGDWSDVWAK